MFVPVWLGFVVTGLVMAAVTVAWAIRTKQFDDQERARFLPLRGLSAEELERPAPRAHVMNRVGMYALLTFGLSGIGALLVLVLKNL